MNKTYVSNFFKHLNTVNTHRKWVRYYCFRMGYHWRGLTHDLSKYSPTEFLESVRYYQGTRSPIDACKEVNGYSLAWFHHRGRNKHHYEYWVDNFDKGLTSNIMPYEYFVEELCDFLGAGRAYMGKDFSYVKEFEWWQKKRESCAMNSQQKKMFDLIFEHFVKQEEVGLDPFETKVSRRATQWFVSEVYRCCKEGIFCD